MTSCSAEILRTTFEFVVVVFLKGLAVVLPVVAGVLTSYFRRIPASASFQACSCSELGALDETAAVFEDRK